MTISYGPGLTIDNPRFSKIKIALDVCFDIILSLISKIQQKKLPSQLTCHLFRFIKRKWELKPMRLNFAVLTASILPGFITAQGHARGILDFSAPRCFGTFYSNSSNMPLLRNKCFSSSAKSSGCRNIVHPCGMSSEWHMLSAGIDGIWNYKTLSLQCYFRHFQFWGFENCLWGQFYSSWTLNWCCYTLTQIILTS